MIKIFTLSTALILVAGCAAMRPSFVYQKPVLHEDIRTRAMAAPGNDEIRHGVKNGIMQLDAGDYESALEYFQSGLRLNPRDGHLHFLHALAYHLQSLSGDSSRLELAETGYLLALKYDPGNYWAAYMLGQIYFSQQRFVDAENHFSYGLLFAPKNQTLLRALSVASYYTRDVGIGHWAASRAYQIAPANPSTLRTLLFSRAALGDIAGANQSLDEYQALFQRVTSQENIKESQTNTVEILSERIADWEKYHQSRNKYAQADSHSVFGTDAQAEGTPPDLDTSSGGTRRSGEDIGTADAVTADDANDDAKRKSPNLPRMALIDVVILSTEESRSQTKGVNLLAGLQATLGGTLYARVRKFGISGTDNVSEITNTKFSPKLEFASLNYNLNIFNDGVNKAEVLARPSLLAIENQTSKFYSGAVLHVEISGTIADAGSLQELPIGIHMEVTPRFHDDDTVEIVVHAQRDNIEEQFAETSVRAFAQVTTTSVDSTAILKFGETLILSGLTERENSQSKGGVPFLQSIPVVQYLFSRTEDEQTKKSVIVLLTPRKPAMVNDKVAAKDADVLAKQEPQQQTYTQELRQKQGIKMSSNIDFAFGHLSDGELYRNFRQGDLKLEAWHERDTLAGAIRRTLGFLYY